MMPAFVKKIVKLLAKIKFLCYNLYYCELLMVKRC